MTRKWLKTTKTTHLEPSFNINRFQLSQWHLSWRYEGNIVRILQFGENFTFLWDFHQIVIFLWKSPKLKISQFWESLKFKKILFDYGKIWIQFIDFWYFNLSIIKKSPFQIARFSIWTLSQNLTIFPYLSTSRISQLLLTQFWPNL